MKILSFSIFDCCHDWQFLFYIRGLFFNTAMARIVYPGYFIHIAVERSIFIKYNDFFIGLSNEYGLIVVVKDEEKLCEMMLWRMAPIFDKAYDYVFARDADALVTYREAQAVNEFIESGLTIHGIADNPAHSVPLMGGMCGFRCEPLREKYDSYKSMIERSPVQINKRGSDQDFLTKVVYSDFEDKFFWHHNFYPSISKQFKPAMVALIPGSDRIRKNELGAPYTKLGLSDLCIDFLGAAGVNEMETLRYLRDNGIDLSLNGIGNKYPNIFYWL